MKNMSSKKSVRGVEVVAIRNKLNEAINLLTADVHFLFSIKSSSSRSLPHEVARVSLRLNSKWRAMTTAVITIVKYRHSGGSSSARRKQTARDNRSCSEQMHVSGFLVIFMNNFVIYDRLLVYVC